MPRGCSCTKTTPSLKKQIAQCDWTSASHTLSLPNARHHVEHTEHQSNALHVACYHPQNIPLPLLRSLLASSPKAPLKRDGRGNAPLHY
eukprot:CAMPEP_0172515230 /NCGR_PEP_ID=MMETSP1066-20121228/266354_1 /TAXON_ID=671091 /ORGANISM="Coscinodiscus wailesii, Strain CCMP2513" /LENGTH=88 /DNA_ID=CAMNT_0013296223 /DNA_START=98 /DNA_END=361 /DNA_ORIENTATION=+